MISIFKKFVETYFVAYYVIYLEKCTVYYWEQYLFCSQMQYAVEFVRSIRSRLQYNSDGVTFVVVVVDFFICAVLKVGC
jgi:hypothetical protein